VTLLGHSVGRSDTGRKRRHNEDSYVHQPPLFAVADGMGGALAGELASRLAIEAIEGRESDSGGVELVTSLVQAANRSVYERSRADSSVSGMGTTMTLALLEGEIVTIGHVGDSRAYLIRDGELKQVTNDHSLVAELMRSGKLTPEEAEHHPQRSVITRALGTDADVDVDTYIVEVQPGDIFLLCSDGLTSMVGNDAILEIVEQNLDDLDAITRELIALANQGGGEDNITVVCFEIAREGDSAVDVANTAVAMPVVTEPDPDDEDTLSGIERVPAVGTMVISPEDMPTAAPEETPTPDPPASSAPEPVSPAAPAKSRRGRRTLVTLAVLTLAGVVVALVVWGLSS
jgi:PPM family protein phosphatase